MPSSHCLIKVCHLVKEKELHRKVSASNNLFWSHRTIYWLGITCLELSDSQSFWTNPPGPWGWFSTSGWTGLWAAWLGGRCPWEPLTGLSLSPAQGVKHPSDQQRPHLPHIKALAERSLSLLLQDQHREHPKMAW